MAVLQAIWPRSLVMDNINEHNKAAQLSAEPGVLSPMNLPHGRVRALSPSDCLGLCAAPHTREQVQVKADTYAGVLQCAIVAGEFEFSNVSTSLIHGLRH